LLWVWQWFFNVTPKAQAIRKTDWPSLKLKTLAGVVAPVVEHPLSKLKALSSNLSTVKKPKIIKGTINRVKRQPGKEGTFAYHISYKGLRFRISKEFYSSQSEKTPLKMSKELE
jgi:hypothetical protein